ncbi:MAG: hypothetical protein J3Q66DRAFT_422874 [Benniella sp.]|nr:MAG: hypothetical protein J3Q66DRAFT_422874 [Benniella sp.]
MLSHNPLEMPELAALIASYLTGKDLARCIRVSKSWRDIFLPHRWRHIGRVYKCSKGSPKRYGPSQEALNNHRLLVQDLHIQRPLMQGDEMCTHLNLRDLWIHLEGEPFIWDLDAKSPLLGCLSLSEAKKDLVCLEGPSKLSRLRSLDLKGATITDVPGFWEAFKNLEHLSMNDVKSGPAFSFAWKAGPVEVRTLIHHPIQKDCGPPLDNLRIPDVPQDDEWASVLERIGNYLGNFTHLDLDGTFGPRAFKALGPHFSSIVDLRLYGISSTVRDVLCFCSMLEILHASNVFTRDIAEGGPLVCRQLRELIMCFRVMESEQDLQAVVFERQSALVRLRHLDMSYLDETSRDGVLEFRLECGWGKLESQKELRVIEFSYEHDTNLMQQSNG